MNNKREKEIIKTSIITIIGTKLAGKAPNKKICDEINLKYPDYEIIITLDIDISD